MVHRDPGEQPVFEVGVLEGKRDQSADYFEEISAELQTIGDDSFVRRRATTKCRVFNRSGDESHRGVVGSGADSACTKWRRFTPCLTGRKLEVTT